MVDAEEHTMVALATGMTTCDCGTINASPDQQDVFIHIEWALREQNKRFRWKLQRIGVLVSDYEDDHPHGRGLCREIKEVLRGL